MQKRDATDGGYRMQGTASAARTSSLHPRRRLARRRGPGPLQAMAGITRGRSVASTQ